jgi:hypothetical protein
VFRNPADEIEHVIERSRALRIRRAVESRRALLRTMRITEIVIPEGMAGEECREIWRRVDRTSPET